ncbi:uncharacterized protein EV422DRAFT_587375 [Fimicolochytrium jonesii]|uniref:uncharacterized protein n=1 Tax=Fimicolochytrium jonesii TaxID=1396493 RepID=UPI0022FE78BC|nr:uncharacterized protein EV422DRAFT_587375 [Fimicolochytrium jonesii]KAI8820665.1 hypothetical protein EV422DRAFT_587375 [Fimicolochytrium jonesii]
MTDTAALDVEKNLDIPVEEADLEDLYSALTAPVENAIPEGPGAAIRTKLDPEYLHKLRMSFLDATAKKQRDLQEMESTAAERLENESGVVLHTISQIIHVNAVSERPEEAQVAFDLITQNGLKPDLVAYNHLMDAYCRVGNLKKVVEVFKSIEAAKLVPDVVSHGILIHACVLRKDVDGAFRMYGRMKAKGVQPTQHIYTSLIKGCLRGNDVSRAWKTFDHMRSTAFVPDNVTYSLMIHACSKTKDAERALGLFEEMAQKNLAPTNVTFTALIQACASRSDYYNDAFALLGQMAAEGFLPNLHTYNVLLQAAALQGDIVRARMIWNDLRDRVEAAGSQGSDLTPTASTFYHMFEAYAHAIRLARRTKRSPGPKAPKSDDSSPSPSTTSFLPNESDTSVAAESAQPEEGNAMPKLSSTETGPAVLLAEAETLWTYLTKLQANARLVNAYLEIACSNPTSTKSIDRALAIYKSAYKEFAIGEPNGYARGIILKAITRNKESMRSYGLETWNELREWDTKREVEMTRGAEERGEGRLREAEKERIRMVEGRGRKHMLANFIRVVNGLTRINDIPAALDTLKEAQTYRYLGYLPAIHFSDVWSLFENVRSQAEDGKLAPAKQMLSLCPPPHASTSSSSPSHVSAAMEEVRRMLGMKHVGGGWWGWEAIGIEADVKHQKRAGASSRNREKLQGTRKAVRRELKGGPVPRAGNWKGRDGSAGSGSSTPSDSSR